MVATVERPKLCPYSVPELKEIIYDRREAEKRYLETKNQKIPFWKKLFTSSDKEVQTAHRKYLEARDKQAEGGALWYADKVQESDLRKIAEWEENLRFKYNRMLERKEQRVVEEQLEEEKVIGERRVTAVKVLGATAVGVTIVAALCSPGSFRDVKIGDPWNWQNNSQTRVVDIYDKPLGPFQSEAQSPPPPEPAKPQPAQEPRPLPPVSTDKAPSLIFPISEFGAKEHRFTRDPLYERLYAEGKIDTPKVSSLKGLSEGLMGQYYLAEQLGGAFDPYNHLHRALLEDLWRTNPVLLDHQRDQLRKYIAYINPLGIYHPNHLDLIYHYEKDGSLRTVIVPANLKRFFDVIKIFPITGDIAMST